VERHVTLLAILSSLWGALGLLLGVSMLILAGGALAELLDPMGTASEFLALRTTGMLGTVGLFGTAWGGTHLWAASLLKRRRPLGRVLSLALAVVNLLVLPLGTAFGVYAMWVLLSEGGRRLFEPPRGGKMES
jgi:hypothetical protein